MNTFNFTQHAPTLEVIEQHFPETYKAIFDTGYKRGFNESYSEGLEEGKRAKAEADKNFTAELEKVCADYWSEKAQQIRHSNACHSDHSVMPSSYASVGERTKAEWDKNANIGSEFTSYASFLAYTKACEAGQVRVCGRGLGTSD